MNELWTIGHSNKTIEAFSSLLRSQRIEAIADVRRFPGSRRYPQFDSEQLTASLASLEIGYIHFPELGGRRKAQKDSPNTAWRNEAFRGYADYMMTGEFQIGMTQLMSLAARKRTAVMCAEVLWWQCHRSLIADHLKANGWKAWHIFGETKVDEHPFTSAARMVEGKLTYSVPAGPMEFRFGGGPQTELAVPG